MFFSKLAFKKPKSQQVLTKIFSHLEDTSYITQPRGFVVKSIIDWENPFFLSYWVTRPFEITAFKCFRQKDNNLSRGVNISSWQPILAWSKRLQNQSCPRNIVKTVASRDIINLLCLKKQHQILNATETTKFSRKESSKRLKSNHMALNWKMRDCKNTKRQHQ